MNKLSQHLFSTLLFSILAIFTTATPAVPPPPPTGLCISTPTGTGCAPAIQPQPQATPSPSSTGSPQPSPGANGNAVKWHPGHYMKVYRDAPQSDFNIIFNEPNVLGVHVEYAWRDLEPQEGVYDFSKIESDLMYLQANGKRLVIRINDRAFSMGYKATPDYLETNPKYKAPVTSISSVNGQSYNMGIAPTKNGTIARIWDPVVMDRLILLYRELGRRFNSEPYVEAIASQESSPGFRNNEPADYTRAKLATQLNRLISAAKQAFPNTVVLQGSNFLSGQIAGIVSNAYQVGAGVLGPDLKPKGPTTSQQIVSSNYKGLMPIADIVSAPVLCGKEGCNLPLDLYNYGVKVLGDNYIFWTRFGTAKDTPSAKYSFKFGMLPVINAFPKTNTACPKNLGSCNTN